MLFLGGGTPQRARSRLLVRLDAAVADGDVGRVEALLAIMGGKVRWSQATGVRLLCDGVVQPVVFDGPVPLAVGSPWDPIPTALRVAVIARDGGCRFPGCRARAQWTDLHHVVWRTKGGATAEHNLVALCRRCHALVHEGGWRLALQRGIDR